MAIESLSVYSSLDHSAMETAVTPQTESSPVSSDIKLFHASLKEAPEADGQVTPANQSSGNSYISDFLKNYQRSSHNAESGLQTASNNPTPANLMYGLTEVSNFDLRARLLSKTVSSGVKGLDKLTSMQ